MQVPRSGGRRIRATGDRFLSAAPKGSDSIAHGSASVTLLGKPVQIHLSRSAQRALAARAQPLLAEMELYFSCLIRKRVRFSTPEPDSEGAAAVADKLRVRFHPVMTAACGKDYDGDEPPLTDFPIARAEAFVPHWLRIDYRGGEWRGEFGYD